MSVLSDAMRAVFGIYDRINTAFNGDGDKPTPTEQEEVTITTAKKELKETAKLWLTEYQKYETTINAKQRKSYSYWAGTQQNDHLGNLDTGRAYTANIIFEATETFLPVATHNNPEAYVEFGDDTPEIREYRDMMKDLFKSHAKNKGLKFELRKSTRHWTTDYIGVLGINWNLSNDDFDIVSIDPKKIIFDTEGFVQWNGLFKGRYVGYRRAVQASRLKEMFKDSTRWVDKKTNDKDGTNVDIIEWWTPEMIFYTDDQATEVFGVRQYPHWNYNEENATVDEYGQEVVEEVQGYNFFKNKEFPFIFITMFNTGRTPHDDTSLIEQCIPSQKVLSKRMAQTDMNADSMNNSYVVSGEYFNTEQAVQFANAMAAGDVGFIPPKQRKDGEYDVAAAYKKEAAVPLPQDVYMQINTAKADIRSIYGTFGLSSQAQMADETVRGKQQSQQSDSSRIGGGIVETLEVVSSTIYMWMLQMMYVYYDPADYAEILGPERAQRYLQLQNLYISLCPQIYVREGSLLPKNPQAERAEAMELFAAGAIDPLTLFERLDFADPVSALTRLLQYKSDPNALIGGVAAQMSPEEQLSTMQAPGTEPTQGYDSEIAPISKL